MIEGSQGSSTALYNAVCVKECPKQNEEYDCMPNEDEPECPKSFYDTQLEFGYCLPEGDDVQAALKQIYDQLNEQSGFGKYLVEIQNCW